MSNQTNGFKLNLPLYVGGKSRLLKNGTWTKKTKKHWLTLNMYRNWHYQTASNTKILFKKEVEEQILALPDLSVLWGEIRLEYTLYPPNKQSRDLTNSMSIVDKYFADALVELGKLKDDSCSHIKAVSCEVGSIDKDHPRMEVVITPYVPR